MSGVGKQARAARLVGEPERAQPVQEPPRCSPPAAPRPTSRHARACTRLRPRAAAAQAGLSARLHELLEERCRGGDLEGLEGKPKGMQRNKVSEIKTEIL